MVRSIDASEPTRDSSRARPHRFSSPQKCHHGAIQEASTRWSRDEDAALKKAVDELGPRDWKRISDEYLGGKRSEAQCYQRWDRTIRVGGWEGEWEWVLCCGCFEVVVLTSLRVKPQRDRWPSRRAPGRPRRTRS